MPKIFIKRSSSTAFLSEKEDMTPLLEEEVTTYKATKRKGKFIIYELPRKGKPIKRRTVKAKKGMKLGDIPLLVQNNKIHISTKRTETNRDKTFNIIQTNYNANIRGFTTIKKDSDGKQRVLQSPQLIGLVRVKDTRREILDHFIGFSSRKKGFKLSGLRLVQAKDEVRAMAIAKFIEVHGLARSSGDIVTKIIELRYQYFKTRK